MTRGRARGGHTTDRSAGGPGSSQHDATKPDREQESGARKPGEAPADTSTSSDRSRVSGGGGERDRHHSHAPARKS